MKKYIGEIVPKRNKPSSPAWTEKVQRRCVKTLIHHNVIILR
jgi:hypothetical protein